MGSEDFYRELRPVPTFRAVADPDVYTSVPEDWHLVITDVRGSTKAVEAGRYKEVNVLGAASIATALNARPGRALPYVFGGDGATILAAEQDLGGIGAALTGLSATADRAFQMDLRVGVVPVGEVVAAGHDVAVAKLAISDDVELAMFWGTGVGHAEELVKGAATEEQYALTPQAHLAHPDVSGLECRWQPLPSRNGRVLSLIVLAASGDVGERSATYGAFLEALEDIAPEARGVSPVAPSSLELARDGDAFEPETRVRTGEDAGLRHAFYKTKTRAQTALARFLMARGMALGGFDGATYQAQVVANTDFRKFDDVLRMVLDLSDDQIAQIESWLENRRRAGRLYYGMHTAPGAMITCLVFDRDRDHVHFVDGADGGYALAAKQLKAQIRDG